MADHDAGDGEEEWRFPLSEFEDDGDGDGDATPGEPADRDGGAVDSPTDETIEPGDPSLEGVVFVLLGVAFTLFVVFRLAAG